MQSYSIYLKETGGGTDLIRLRAPASASAYTFSLPPDGGTSGFVLRTDGSGTTTWVDAGDTYTGGTGVDISSGNIIYIDGLTKFDYDRERSKSKKRKIIYE